VVTTPPPSSLTAGQTFTLGVSAEDAYGNVVPTFNGNVTIALPNGTTDTVQALNGVATFAGLTADTVAQGGTIQATAGGLSSGTTVVEPVPTIIGEHVVPTYLKYKKNKPVGKPVVSIVFTFSIAMKAATTDYKNNYVVEWASIKKSKKTVTTTLHRVGILSAMPNASNTSVTLLTSTPLKTFAKGGQITVIYTPPNGVSSAAGVPLSAADSTFTISQNAKSIKPGG
jgi:hypothetical protein